MDGSFKHIRSQEGKGAQWNEVKTGLVASSLPALYLLPVTLESFLRMAFLAC